MLFEPKGDNRTGCYGDGMPPLPIMLGDALPSKLKPTILTCSLSDEVGFRKNEYLRCVTEEYGMISEIRMEKGGLRTDIQGGGEEGKLARVSGAVKRDSEPAYSILLALIA
ncbi:unnamed protein product [Enterobius vermicularis]|uniref:Reverse transcriptase domain-containing protein n=1 Tax=Enterobius vermicularis TaxID=51028 RepID=A0A0N4UVN8_ENTVE|nr:unnamed protein product [Enterobius vermicularis]